MWTARIWAGLVSGVVAVAAVTGCADPEKLQVAALQDRINQLERENAELTRRIQQLLADQQRNRDEIARLLRELDAARNAAPAPAVPGWTTEGGIAWTDIADDILFDSGKAVLKSSGKAKIQQVVNEIRQNFANASIWVVGHTDSDPIKYTAKEWADNLELSINRGAAVTREMMKLGVDPRTVVAGGQGEFNPKVPNDSKANKQLNRRVQVIAIPRPTGTTTSGTTDTGAGG